MNKSANGRGSEEEGRRNSRNDLPCVELDIEHQTRVARLEGLNDLSSEQGPDEDLFVVSVGASSRRE